MKHFFNDIISTILLLLLNHPLQKLVKENKKLKPVFQKVNVENKEY